MTPLERRQRSFLDSRTYALVRRFSSCVGLGLLWTAASLPVLTLFPATAALFAVVRRWVDGEDTAVWTTFGRGFRDHFLKASAVQAMWSVLAFGLLADISLARTLAPLPQAMLVAVAVVAGTVLAATTMFVFPLMVSHRIRLVELLKLSVMLGIGRPLTALRCLALVALAIAFTAAFPPSLILGSALTAVAWHWSCRPAMAQVVRSSEPLATSGQPS